MLDRRIELLRVVAEVGTITGAAEVLYRSASGVSRQLHELSRELGVELLEPEGRKVRLTPAASALVEYADRAAVLWEQTRASLRSDGRLTGTLQIAAHPSAVATLVAPILPALRHTHPGLTLTVIEAQPPDGFRLLLTERADVCIAVAEEGIPLRANPKYHQENLVKEPIDALLPADHRLAQRSSIALPELADESWILPAPWQAGHREFMTACHSAGFTPAHAHYAQDWSATAALAHTTHAVSLISRFATLPATAPVTRVPLEGNPAPARQLVFCTRAGAQTTPAVSIFHSALRNQATHSARSRH